MCNPLIKAMSISAHAWVSRRRRGARRTGGKRANQLGQLCDMCTATTGANDHLVKPVAVKELNARLRAVRRRNRGGSAPAAALVLGDLEIVPDAGEIRLRGEPMAVTRTEFRLLCELGEHARRVLSRQQLLSGSGSTSTGTSAW
jgi:hypothetical protein